MIRHTLRLIWNRRRGNALIFMELLLCFLVLCAVLTIAGNDVRHWRQPLGFAYRDVWQLRLYLPGSLFTPNPQGGGDAARWEQIWRQVDQLLLLLRDLDPVEAVSPLPVNTPFTDNSLNTRTYVNGAPRSVNTWEIDPEMREVLKLKLLAGRWLDPGDAQLNWKPVVVTNNFAQALFGRNDPLGQPLPNLDDEGRQQKLQPGEKESRVVGVLADIRRGGDFSAAPFIICNLMDRAPTFMLLGDYLIRMRPGTTAAFEEELLRRIRQIDPSWAATVTPLTRFRHDRLRNELLPLAIFAVVAGFLVAMVGLGLIGVLWQSVTRRRQEIGLRRALGATAIDVERQVLGELLLLAVLAVAVGTLLVAQLPILRLFPGVAWYTYALGAAAAALTIGLFVLACGWYPSWLAARVQPAEALQYE